MAKTEYTFLLIDDQKSEMDAFIIAGKHRGINIVSIDNVTDGIYKLKAEPERFHAVILDAKCKLRKTDQAESYNEAALHSALKDLNDMAKATGRKLPRCVYTGYSDAAANHELTETVFKKGGRGTETELFNYLIGAIKNDPRNVALQRYDDVISMFSTGHLPEKGKEDLVQLLMELDDLTPSKIKSNLTRTRNALEMMLTRFSELDEPTLPPALLQSTSWVSESLNFLAARGDYKDQSAVLPEHLFSILFTVQKATSKAGAHWYTDFVSHYAMRSLAYGLLEGLLWFKSYLDDNGITVKP